MANGALCGAYHRLNDSATLDCYPTPHIQDFTSNLAGKTIFSKTDFFRTYHPIPDGLYNSIFGLYEFYCMPFVLRNATQTFQLLIDDVCRDLDFVLFYLDDILVSSSCLDEYLEHLQILFQR